MPMITADTGIVTQINVFTVPEGGQQALIDLLTEAAHACRAVPGWISASLHRSLEGTRVVNYAQASDRAAMARVFEVCSKADFSSATARSASRIPGCTRWS
jgi:quinol monooxygenase YgiN